MKMNESISNFLVFIFTFIFLIAIGEIVLRWGVKLNTLKFQVDEELLWKYRPNQVGTMWMGWGSFRSPVTSINEFGFRGPKWTNREGRYRIMTIGDSFTFGTGVLDTQTTSYRLEQLLNNEKVVVANFGMSGYGTFQAKRALEIYADTVKPDIVIFIFHPGMITRQPFESEEKKLEFINKSRLRQKVRDISVFITFVYRKLWYLTHTTTRTSAEDWRAVLPDNWQKDFHRIRNMADFCKKRGAKFFVLLWPFPLLPEWSLKVKSDLNSVAAENGFRVLDGLEEVFNQYTWEELLIEGDGHPTVLAHQLAAEYLASILRTEITENFNSNTLLLQSKLDRISVKH